MKQVRPDTHVVQGKSSVPPPSPDQERSLCIDFTGQFPISLCFPRNKQSLVWFCSLVHPSAGGMPEIREGQRGCRVTWQACHMGGNGGATFGWKTLPSCLDGSRPRWVPGPPSYLLHPGVSTLLQFAPAQEKKNVSGNSRAAQAWLDPELQQGLQGILCLTSLFCFPPSVGWRPQQTLFMWQDRCPRAAPILFSYLLGTSMRKTLFPGRFSPQTQEGPLTGPVGSRVCSRAGSSEGGNEYSNWGMSTFGSWAKKGQGQLTSGTQKEFPAGKRAAFQKGGGYNADRTRKCCPWKLRLLKP